MTGHRSGRFKSWAKALENTMEKEFFDLYARQSLFALEVGHNSIADWGVHIYDRRGKASGDWGSPVISETGPDRARVFARAYLAFTEYMSSTRGGY
jgi:hypothetical protein